MPMKRPLVPVPVPIGRMSRAAAEPSRGLEGATCFGARARALLGPDIPQERRGGRVHARVGLGGLRDGDRRGGRLSIPRECEIFSRHVAGQPHLRPEQAGLPAEPAGSVCIGSTRLGAWPPPPRGARRKPAAMEMDRPRRANRCRECASIQGVEVNLARARMGLLLSSRWIDVTARRSSGFARRSIRLLNCCWTCGWRREDRRGHDESFCGEQAKLLCIR
jgi:hypothetical protein